MIQTSFPSVAEQVVNYNKNVIDILSRLSNITSTTDSIVNLQLFDQSGKAVNFALPTLKKLEADIERLNNNINSLYNLNGNGSLMQTGNSSKKIITVDLNKEPSSITSLGTVTSFKAKNNWFFDSLLNPMLNVEVDLSNQISDANVRRCLVRRYIVEFEKDINGVLTNLGQSALNSFNTLYRGNSTILISDFENWHTTTPGISNPLNPRIDEQTFELDPAELQYDGKFTVFKPKEDILNKKLWYPLNTLEYVDLLTNKAVQLQIGSELIINMPNSSSRYKIIEISTSDNIPKVRFERVEGFEPIPVGIDMMKIYSPVINNKKVNISIGYDERNVIFIKPINIENNIVSRNWSLGSAYWTNDLRLSANSSINGITMEQFYIDYVYDYGVVIQDLVAKKIPNSLGATPPVSVLDLNNFKVVQINKHLTDTPDSNALKQKHNYQQSLKSELEQIETALKERYNKKISSGLISGSTKNKYQTEYDELEIKKFNKMKLLSSATNEILALSNNPLSKVDPSFRVRGFWAMPSSVVTSGTQPQEVVQFRIQYRYLSKDGKETPIETFKVNETNEKAAFSNWVEFKTDARKRVYDKVTGSYSWEIQDIANSETFNINQLDIPIKPNEKVEIRIKSISEAGWPESPLESDWSNIITVEFPNDLVNVLNQNDNFLKNAAAEDLKMKLNSELAAKGLDEHLKDTIVNNNVTYHHEASTIASGFKDENNLILSLLDHLKRQDDRIKALEEKIKRAKGELEVVIMRNNKEFIIKNATETTFTIECEDYLDKYTETGIPSGRVYSNNIYVIKDFVLRVRNKSIDSPLGLLSDKSYTQYKNVYDSAVPQVFWVNDLGELITVDNTSTGQTKTQMNNQFVWSVNYDSIIGDNVSKLSENIGNNFANSNSLTKILSSSEFNLGYNENSILSFGKSNKSLLESSKWIDTTLSVNSSTKLLTSIHPVVKNIEDVTETNSDKIKTITSGDNNSIVIPINIYFKMNALDNSQPGLNNKYINLNNAKQTITHVKKVKFLLENEAENKPFSFSIKFNINRNKVTFTNKNIDRDLPYIVNANSAEKTWNDFNNNNL